MCVCARDEQRHQALEPPRPPPTTKKRHISLFAPYIMRKPRRGRGVRLYLLSPLYPLSYVSRMCLCCLSLTVNDCVCVICTQRDQSASQERISTVMALVSGAMPLTHRRQTVAVSRYTQSRSKSWRIGRSRRFVRLPWLGLHCTSWRRRRMSMPSSMSDARF